MRDGERIFAAGPKILLRDREKFEIKRFEIKRENYGVFGENV